MVLFFIAGRFLRTSNPGIATFLFLTTTLGVLIAATALANKCAQKMVNKTIGKRLSVAKGTKAAQKSNPGQTARLVWILIALMPLTDSISLLSFIVPQIVTDSLSGLLVGISTAILSLSRILAAIAFFMMYRVYRKSGLPLNLRKRDGVMMAVIMVLGIVLVMLSNKIALVSGGAQFQNLVLLTGLPLMIALIPCAIFGVMVWRYATQMGGGLVAKAWQSIFLYAVVWIVRLVATGLIAYLPGDKTSTYWMLSGYTLSFLMLASEYLIFLGASYQYEACTSPLRLEEELKAFQAAAAEFDLSAEEPSLVPDH